MTGLKKLGQPSKFLDHCGAYDFKGKKEEDREIVFEPSRHEPWSDASKFLNYLGIEFLDGFHMVIVDNMSTPERERDTICFDYSSKIGMSVIALAFGLLSL